MKLKKQKMKSKFLAVTVALFMLLANGGIMLINTTRQALSKFVFADYTPTEVTLSNGDFTNPSSGSLPYSPTNWTVMNKSGDITSGIINLGSSFEEKQQDTYNLTFKPDATVLKDNQVLMINSADTNSSCGYKSSPFKLSTNSYYILSFKAYTENTTNHSAFGSAILTGDNSDVIADKMLLINTSDNSTSNWKTYSIFIETDSINEKSLNLELWLGEKDGNKSNGAIFFDEVKIMCYDNYTYNVKKQSRNVNTSMVVNFNTDYVDDFIANSNFENGLNGWSLVENSSSTASNVCITGVYDVNSGYDASSTNIEKNPTNANIYNNNKALLINNLDYGHIGYTSSYFTVNQNALYKLSFIAKTNQIDGPAIVKLIERNPYTNEYLSDGTTKNPNYYVNSSYKEQTFTIENISTYDYSNQKLNDWKYYSFYIQGSPYVNTEMSIEIWLGTEDEDATGYAFFDYFTLQKLNTEDFETGNSNGTIANLNQATTSTDISNCAFNNVVLNTPNDSAPYKPADWTLSQNNTSSFNGVINTADTSNANIPAIQPINSKYSNNNVLMIGNTADNSQKYTSNSFNLPSDGYIKVQASVLTYNLNKAFAGLRLICNGNVIGEILDIDSDTWTTYCFVIKTGYESKSVTLELSLGETVEGTGYAFFDNIIVENDLTSEDYAENIANCKKINLASYDFSNISSTPTNGKYTPYDFSVSNNSNTNINYLSTGIIDTSTFGQSGGCEDSNYANPGHPSDENSYVLMIESSEDAYYTYTTKSTSKLTANNYYKIVVKVKTNSVCQNDENSKVLIAGSKTNYHPFGASIAIDGIDAKFTGIDTNGEWKDYTIYVNCTTDAEVKILLSLGDINAYTSGAVYYSSATITSLTSEEYTLGIAVLENDAPDNIMAIGNTDIDEQEEETTSNSVNFDWLLVPSIITAVAILVAVVGTIIRKTKKASKKQTAVKPYSKENIKKLLRAGW